MPFAAFRAARDPRVYLQAPILVCRDYSAAQLEAAPGLGARLRTIAEDARNALERYRAAGRLGPWARTQLFVSHSGATSPLHFDQYANLFLQLRGHKRVTVAPPEFAEFAKPHAAHSPLDSYARAPDATGPARVPAILGPGDCLFIPPFWWHSVETLDDDCVSMNFWFGTEAELLARPEAPIPPFKEHELFRLVQYLVHDTRGPTAVRPFLQALADELGDDPPPPTPPNLALLNYVATQLAALLGAAGLAAFRDTYLRPFLA